MLVSRRLGAAPPAAAVAAKVARFSLTTRYGGMACLAAASPSAVHDVGPYQCCDRSGRFIDHPVGRADGDGNMAGFHENPFRRCRRSGR